MAQLASQPLRLRSFLAAVGLTVAVCFTATFALPQDPYIRYQAMAGTMFERVRWMYDRIHYDDTPIDIVFIGSSRTARGVISPDLETALHAQGHDKRIVNFSLPASGYDVRLTLAREVLEARDVELLVISLVEQFPRDGHQAFADLATVEDLLRSPWLVNRNLPENLLRLPVRQMQLAVMSLLPEAFGYRRAFDPDAYEGATVDPRIFNPGRQSRPQTSEAITALEKESRFRRRDLTPPILPTSLNWIEFGVTQSYIRRLVELAQAHDTQIAFLYLPFYKGFAQPLETDWLEQYGPVLSADFLRMSPENYNDAAHVSEQGAQLMTDWLSRELPPLLKDAE